MNSTATMPSSVATRVRAWVARKDPDQLALGLPLLIAGVYLVRLAQTFQDRLTVTGGNSDAISSLFIAATMDEVPEGDINMGNFGHYMVLAYARATEWLPFYREVWQAMPPALWMASVAIVVWAAWRSFGGWAAVLTGVIGLCLSPYMVSILFTSSYHTWTLYSCAIAAGLLVFLTTQAGMSVRAWIVAVAGVLLLGGALASDRLVLLSTIGPLLLAGAGVAISHPTRQGRMFGLVAGAIAVGAVVIGIAVTEIMEASGFVTEPRTVGWIGEGLFFSNVAAFLEETLWMLDGHFFGRPLSFESTLSFATALGALVALIAPFTALRRRLRHPQIADTDREIRQSAYIFFWAATMAILALASIASDQILSGRYFLPVVFAAAATVPLLPRSVTARYILIAGVSIYALLGALNLDATSQQGDLRSDAGQVAIRANELISIARQEEAYIGYAGYTDAAAMSWSTKLQVKVFPVEYACLTARDGLCTDEAFTNRARDVFTNAGWYVPRPDTRSFLIGPTPEESESYQPPRWLGRPLSTHRLVDGALLYVYPHDIAGRFSS